MLVKLFGRFLNVLKDNKKLTANYKVLPKKGGLNICAFLSIFGVGFKRL